MITKSQRYNAERIVQLDQHFGHLTTEHGQRIRDLFNLTIPCATLIQAEIVTGVKDTFDAVNDQAVRNLEHYVTEILEREGTTIERELFGEDFS